MRFFCCAAAFGSSPHTRGARGGVLVHLPVAGIIPAYAGSTSGVKSSSSLSSDHPRIRGEHLYMVRCPNGIVGSSPHTRGAPDRVDRVHDVGRIIPAYAGSTPTACSLRANGSDHPRIRGEHVSLPGQLGEFGGSSPHTRGALRSMVTRSLESADHPRIRGEHLPVGCMIIARRGSSPHTRGALSGSRCGWST